MPHPPPAPHTQASSLGADSAQSSRCDLSPHSLQTRTKSQYDASHILFVTPCTLCFQFLAPLHAPRSTAATCLAHSAQRLLLLHWQRLRRHTHRQALHDAHRANAAATLCSPGSITGYRKPPQTGRSWPSSICTRRWCRFFAMALSLLFPAPARANLAMAHRQGCFRSWKSAAIIDPAHTTTPHAVDGAPDLVRRCIPCRAFARLPGIARLHSPAQRICAQVFW